MLTKQIKELTKTIQHNCHIADANHAGDYTLCIYLLKMREFYRWEQDETFSTNLANKTVGKWLRQREELWDGLEDSEYLNIEIGKKSLSPFESDSINENLQKHQLVYSGGIGINNRPHFFLAELDISEQHKDYNLYIAGKEYARDMSAPPAMSQQNNIYIRKESFRRLLWEKLETWRWNKPDNALGRAFACYDCEKNLDLALMQMTDAEVNNVIQHERGEILAIRDHLADSLTTLPALLLSNSAPSWNFYFGNLNNMRKDLFPSIIKGYNEWHETGSLSKISDIIAQGQEHWLQLCQEILQINEPDIKSQQTEIQNLIERNRL